MLPVLWGLIGSYATLAEQPVWALATKKFDKAFQFDQKWLEFLPKLVELAAAEGAIVYLEDARHLSEISYDSANRAKRAAAAGGHMDTLNWLEALHPMKYVCTEEFMGVSYIYGGEGDNDVADAVQIWISGVSHPEVRERARGPALKYLEDIYHDSQEERFNAEVMSVAASQGNITALQFLYGNMGEGFYTNGVMRILISWGHLAAIEWCDSLQPGRCEDSRGEAIATAISYNRLDVLKILIGKKYSFDKETVCEITADGVILRYLVSIGCRVDESTYLKVARDGEIETLEWLHEQKCPGSPVEALKEAARTNNYPVVEHLLKAGVETDYRIINSASANGDLKMIRLCVANGVRWSGAEMAKAARNNHIPALELLKSLGAPMRANACNAALDSCSYEAYLWLRKAGCPQNAQTAELLCRSPAFLRNSTEK